MNRLLGIALLSGGIVLWGACPPVAAGDWNQWRGPARDAVSADFPARQAWPSALALRWRVEVGQGHASPVVAGDHVFLLARQGEEEVVRALSLADGLEHWARRYRAPFEMSPYAKGHGQGPKSTPIVSDGRLFTLGIGGVLSAWDAQSGKPVWQRDFAKTYPKGSSLWYGASSSPLMEAGLLVVHVGGRGEGALAALDAKTGETRWQWDGDGAAYVSPVAATLGGARHILTQSQNACLGVSAADGRLLWKVPFTTEYDQNIITPLVRDNEVLFAGLEKPTALFRLRKAEDRWVAETLWENDQFPLYMSSPVRIGGRLIGLTNRKKGQFFAADWATGKILWTSDGRMGEYAALLAVGGAVLAQLESGQLLVIDPSADRFHTLARYKVADSPTWAHPALAGTRILVKDRETLAAWDFQP